MGREGDHPLFLSLTEAERKLGQQKWLVKGLIPADSTGLLFGETGSYKTFLALDLSLHIAHGLEWCGLKTIAGPVCYIAGEGGLSITKRTAAWHKYRGLDQSEAGFFLCPQPLYIDDFEDLERIVKGIDTVCPCPPSLIVIDTLSQCMQGMEDSNSDISNLLAMVVSELRSLYPGCVVLLLHHPGHSDKKRMRGASALRANSDFVLRAEKCGSSRQVKLVPSKCKDGELQSEKEFRLEVVELGEDEDGEPISSLVAVFQNNGVLPGQEKRKQLGKYETQVVAYLNENESVLERELREALLTTGNPLGMAAQKSSKARGVARALDDLEKNGRITRDDRGFVALSRDGDDL